MSIRTDAAASNVNIKQSTAAQELDLQAPLEAPQKAGAKKYWGSKTRRFVWGSVLPALVLVLWQIASWQGWVSDLLFPSPIAILKEFYTIVKSGDLFWHLKISLQRALIGFGLGGSAGLLLGLLVGMFKRAEDLLDPTIQMLRTVPLLAITPLFILWFGFGELSKDLLIAMGAFFPLYVNTFLGVRNVDAKLFEVAKVLEFNRYQQITKLVLPSALPNVLLGLRLSLSVAWLCLVVAELMGSDQGIGYMIQDARSFMRTGVVFVGIAIFAFVGKLTDSLVRILENRLLRWQDSYKG
ncbi:ABC transporter permease [Paenibacillus eucommiae]|uniref:Sulfonate transport system permease protein n=1 Tax=Paenibacillus eucommiae TaxID=1355755 RepID=A0ABS4J304_9BACL|nr:ABC transporter permease [Paenibacillus eucommiae]MBP1993631.1 sulfonate transport system permease protein [Paenibacillus eucommiae]